MNIFYLDADGNSTWQDPSVGVSEIEDISSMRVIGNVTGSTATPTEVVVVRETDSIASNDNDTTIPTSAAVKDYVDNSSNYTPATYAGEESIELPNGLVMKFGIVTGTGDRSVTFATAFDTAVINISVTNIDSGSEDSAGTSNPHIKTGYSTTGFTTYVNSLSSSGSFWQAIGD